MTPRDPHELRRSMEEMRAHRERQFRVAVALLVLGMGLAGTLIVIAIWRLLQ